MEKMLTKVLCTAALLSSAVYAANTTTTTPFINGRSDSVRLGRVLAGTQDLINQHGRDSFYGQFSITGGGGQTFRSERIAHAFFGADLVGSTDAASSCNTSCKSKCLHFSNAATEDRAATDWLADYAGVGLGSEAYESTVCFAPRQTKGFADFSFYTGLDNWMCGLWFSAHAPVVHVRSELRVTESNNGAESVLPYFRGEEVAEGQEALAYGKWAECRQSKTRLSDVHMDLGYNFWSCEDYHAGLSLHVSAPAGNRPCGAYLFEPIVGNGKHWAVGAGFTGHVSLWSCEENDSDFGLYVDATVSHLFKARQTRTFDLKNKANSRYVVAQPLNDDLTPADITATVKAAPVANLTAQDVDVKINVEADMAARFVYTYCAWGFELGYNLWATSREEFSDRKNCTAPRLATEKYFVNDATINAGPVEAASENEALKVSDINRVGTKGLSHTVFGHMNYTWEANDDCCWGFFVGLGGEAELGSRDSDSCKTTATTTSSCSTKCNDYVKVSLSSWTVWAKAGVTF